MFFIVSSHGLASAVQPQPSQIPAAEGLTKGTGLYLLPPVIINPSAGERNRNNGHELYGIRRSVFRRNMLALQFTIHQHTGGSPVGNPTGMGPFCLEENDEEGRANAAERELETDQDLRDRLKPISASDTKKSRAYAQSTWFTKELFKFHEPVNGTFSPRVTWHVSR